jgi:enoyl-CoA hydratase/carnithine racemase
MSYAQFKTLLVEKKDGIATVTMNQPDKLNAIDEGMHRDLEHIWPVLSDDPEVSVIILTGAGRAFSAGGDIKGMIGRFGTPDGAKRAIGATFHAKNLAGSMLNVHKPMISAVNGDALGLGTTLALLCDISVVSETAKMGDTHVRVGLVAGDGGTAIWPLLIGVNRAKEFLMRGTVLSGKEAAEKGIASHAFPADKVMEEAVKIAQEINRLPPLAVQWSKVSANAILKQQFNLAFDSGIAFEALSMFTADHNEACKAFVEKRKPTYKGA